MRWLPQNNIEMDRLEAIADPLVYTCCSLYLVYESIQSTSAQMNLATELGIVLLTYATFVSISIFDKRSRLYDTDPEEYKKISSTSTYSDV